MSDKIFMSVTDNDSDITIPFHCLQFERLITYNN